MSAALGAVFSAWAKLQLKCAPGAAVLELGGYSVGEEGKPREEVRGKPREEGCPSSSSSVSGSHAKKQKR